MMTFKNAGLGGPDNSTLSVNALRNGAVYSVHGEVFEPPQDGVTFRIGQQPDRPINVILNPDQVRELHRQLGDWLTLRSPIQKITMIDGITL